MKDEKLKFWNCVKWHQNKMLVLDQTKLPLETAFEEMVNIQEVWDAVYQLKVRGAPAIGVAAGYGLYLSIMNYETDSYDQFWNEIQKNSDYLASSRPTAVNLFWALDRMKKCAQGAKGKTIEEIKQLLLKEAQAIEDENSDICKKNR